MEARDDVIKIRQLANIICPKLSFILLSAEPYMDDDEDI